MVADGDNVNALEAFHAAHVELLNRIVAAKQEVWRVPTWSDVKKRVETAALDITYLDELEMLRSYYEVYDD